MNKFIGTGNLGADSELRATTSGDHILNFNLATTEHYKDKDGNKKSITQWHRCVLWGNRGASLAQYLRKGTKVLIEGQVTYRKYEKDGVQRTSTEIKVYDVELLGEKKEDSGYGY